MCDFGAVFSVAHHQGFYIFYVAYNEFVETVWKNVASLFIATVTNLWAPWRTFESTALAAINTFWFAPLFWYLLELIAMEVLELGLLFLDDLSFGDPNGRGQS